MTLHDFILRNKNTAILSGGDSSVTFVVTETIGQEIEIHAEGYIFRETGRREIDPCKQEPDNVVFYCTNVVATVDGFDLIDELDMPEKPEKVVEEFVNEWYQDEMQSEN